MAEEEKDKKPESQEKDKSEKTEGADVPKKEVEEVKADTGKDAPVETKVSEEKPEKAEDAKTEAKEGTKEDVKEEVKEEVKSEEKPETVKVEETKPVTEPESNDEQVEAESEESAPKKKKGWFRLPSLGKKDKSGDSKKSEPEEVEGKSEGDKEAEPTDVEIHDETLQLIEKAEDELAQKITDDVDLASDMFVIRISKSRLMLVLGVLVLMMWMIPAFRGAQMLMEKTGFKFGQQNQAAETIEEEQVVKIKVRHDPDQKEIVDELTDLLSDSGYDFIEIEEEETTVFEGVAVITKNTDIETRIKIESLLTQKYKISSPSAELTDDSDFDAVIIIGNEKKK